MPTFGEKLKGLRDNRGLSEAKLAEASGVSFAALHDYGLGRRKPSFAAVVKIARALGVTCEAFAACEDIAVDSQAEAPARPVKRPRGRPRKQPVEAPAVEPAPAGKKARTRKEK